MTAHALLPDAPLPTAALLPVLLTGAGGFVGRAVARQLLRRGYTVHAGTRDAARDAARLAQALGGCGAGADTANLHWHTVGDIHAHTPWQVALDGRGVGTIIHSAGRAQQTSGTAQEHRVVNVDGTLRLAHHAVQAGVRRFVYLSSITVHGSTSAAPVTESSAPKPGNAYAASKLQAERALLALGAESGLEVVIVRPPLVYGPQAQGNFALLARCVLKGLPLPLGAVRGNRRSFIALDNLVDFILLCAERTRSPEAAGRVFLISDTQDVSTTELLQRMARAAQRPSRLLPVPAELLRLALRVLGRPGMADSLLGSMQADVTLARTLLGWRPVVDMDTALEQALATLNPGTDAGPLHR